MHETGDSNGLASYSQVWSPEEGANFAATIVKCIGNFSQQLSCLSKDLYIAAVIAATTFFFKVLVCLCIQHFHHFDCCQRTDEVRDLAHQFSSVLIWNDLCLPFSRKVTAAKAQLVNSFLASIHSGHNCCVSNSSRSARDWTWGTDLQPFGLLISS